MLELWKAEWRRKSTERGQGWKNKGEGTRNTVMSQNIQHQRGKMHSAEIIYL